MARALKDPVCHSAQNWKKVPRDAGESLAEQDPDTRYGNRGSIRLHHNPREVFGMNQKKSVLLCISGGIAAYKSAYVASGLNKRGYDVHVLMTRNATEFISPAHI